jgi:hypothetical protein
MVEEEWPGSFTGKRGEKVQRRKSTKKQEMADVPMLLLDEYDEH